MYDTWGGKPYINQTYTWYLSHPAYAVFVSSWFSAFKPATAFCIWNFAAILIVFISGLIMSSCVEKPQHKGVILCISTISFPFFLTLYTGNSHSVIVLSFTCILSGMLKLQQANRFNGHLLVLLGLLISLFSKPVVLLMLPMFLIVKETRKLTVFSIVFYVLVSILFIILPILNPESIGLKGILKLIGNFNYVKQHMNVYANNYILTPEMKCNSIHWFNLIAQAEYYFSHIDIFSLAVFINDATGKIYPPLLFKLPLYTSLLATSLLFLIGKSDRIIAAIILFVMFACTYYLSYNTVWEYQYSAIMPLFGLFAILKIKKFLVGNISASFFILSCILISLPSLYITSKYIQNYTLQIIVMRSTRLVPVAAIYITSALLILRMVIRHTRIKFDQGSLVH
ncbi:MAG: hypothetical protein JW915_18745 [Chitinispirillaceae bacterium]|nr:hypothetical protein [Chitinispirillaceae bacterium]